MDRQSTADTAPKHGIRSFCGPPESVRPAWTLSARLASRSELVGAGTAVEDGDVVAVATGQSFELVTVHSVRDLLRRVVLEMHVLAGEGPTPEATNTFARLAEQARGVERR
jgi:hypothetical protein